VQDAVAWSTGSSNYQGVHSESNEPHLSAPIVIEGPGHVGFAMGSPKSESFPNSTMATHFNYPWSIEHGGDAMNANSAASLPRAAVGDASIIRSPPSDDFAAWLQDNPESHHSKGSPDGSHHSVVDAAAGNVRNVAVLEVHD